MPLYLQEYFLHSDGFPCNPLQLKYKDFYPFNDHAIMCIVVVSSMFLNFIFHQLIRVSNCPLNGKHVNILFFCMSNH